MQNVSDFGSGRDGPSHLPGIGSFRNENNLSAVSPRGLISATSQSAVTNRSITEFGKTSAVVSPASLLDGNPAQVTRFGGNEAQNSGVLAQQANAAIAGQTFHPIQTSTVARARVRSNS